MELPDRLADRYQCHRDRKLGCIKRRAGTGVWLPSNHYTPNAWADTINK